MVEFEIHDAHSAAHPIDMSSVVLHTHVVPVRWCWCARASLKCPARKRKRKRRGWPVSASGVILPSEPPGKARVFPDTSDDFDAEGASRADSSIEPARLTHNPTLHIPHNGRSPRKEVPHARRYGNVTSNLRARWRLTADPAKPMWPFYAAGMSRIARDGRVQKKKSLRYTDATSE